jgi:hypothetical protein
MSGLKKACENWILETLPATNSAAPYLAFFARCGAPEFVVCENS